MRQLPDVIKINEQFGGRDDFALFTVSYDRTTTIDRMHEVIKEYGITYPVLHQFVDEKPWAFGYTVRYIPKSVLIDPMGNIWGDVHFNADLPEVLDFMLAQPEGFLPVIFEPKLVESGDGNAFQATLYSPTHVQAEFKVELSSVNEAGDEEALPGLSGPDGLPDYDGFGYFTPAFAVPDDAVSVRYSLELVMPGSEHLNDGKGLVISKNGSFEFEVKE